MGINNKTLGEAQIAVYQRGEKIVLDPDSPYFKDLQLACEEVLKHSFSEPLSCEDIKNSPQLPKKVKNNEYAIELTYRTLISQKELGFLQNLTRFIPISQVLIPLSGELTNFKYKNRRFVVFFPFTTISSPNGKIEMINWSVENCVLVGGKKDIKKIKNTLMSFNITAN